MADTADINDPSVNSGTVTTFKTLEWLNTQLGALLGPLNATKVTDPAAASATLNALLRGILDNTGNGVVLTANMVSGVTSAITNTTAAAAIAAAGTGIRNMVGTVIIANSSTVDTFVDILSGTTVLATVFSPAKSTVGFNANTPLKGGTNEAINIQAATTGANIKATVIGWKE